MLSTPMRDAVGASLGLHMSPEFVSHRVGPGGRQLPYVSVGDAVNIANEMFGHDGWSSEIRNSTVTNSERSEDGRGTWSVSATAVVRVTLAEQAGGSFREGLGCGSVKSPDKPQAFENAQKEAASDGLKRALSLFGNATGNSLHQPEYLKALHAVRAVRPKVDLKDTSTVYRGGQGATGHKGRGKAGNSMGRGAGGTTNKRKKVDGGAVVKTESVDGSSYGDLSDSEFQNLDV